MTIGLRYKFYLADLDLNPVTKLLETPIIVLSLVHQWSCLARMAIEIASRYGC